MNLDVVLKDVCLNYKTLKALKDVSFSLSPGKIYGLMGRNGAGKTSLLSLLASYRQPSSGIIRIGGEEPFENRKIMSNVSFSYMTDYSDEDEQVSCYLEFSERYRPDFDLKYATELAAQFKLPLDKPINKLSSGKQSALNATLGLASRTPVTIFDEVYVGMDAPARDLFYREVLEEQSRHPRLIILSTHLVSEMEYLFDHVLILDQGTLKIDKPIDEVMSRGASITGEAELVDSFVSSMTQLNTKQLGSTKSVMVYEDITETQRFEAETLGLEIGSVALQDLFIHLTREEE
ncbi:ATP-binding cassette domain-containing protein [Candidatus Contubernalis alkaliaceticus]|uniref:ATP-binding cassette domain-containing protein n=1 Tax=Candidatus Contubernalis alkaliaceticus TaxID=338645 RepID=UPI001F4BE47E|nr:ABC transporter ATP-binding protein [Candidatus Contubernalis alkalaceticus]UNC93214.1 ABC transporter ATP-binding protein [Candidatus Contubernalis alkalaceticus]